MKCISLTVPELPSDIATPSIYLQVEGQPVNRSSSGYTFRDELFISSLQRWNTFQFTFVQTDKKTYKPGDLGE